MLDEKGGVKEGGWDWNRSTETLNINDKFSGNKQIVFASGINPKIKVNRSVTLNPDAGEAGIKTSGDLEIFTDGNVKLNIHGTVEAKNVTIKNDISVETQGIEAENNIAVMDSASVIVKADRPESALYAKNGNIVISGKSTVIVSNQNGAALNTAPNTGNYEGCRIVVSRDVSGRPVEEYFPEKILEYQYFKVESMLSKEEIEESVKKLTEESSPELVDSLADQIRELPEADRRSLDWETIQKVDQLLQKASGIKAAVDIEVPANLGSGKRIQNAEITGALLASALLPQIKER